MTAPGGRDLRGEEVHPGLPGVPAQKIGEVIENGGTLQDAYEIDQSPYMHLPTAGFLAKRNAGQVFQGMSSSSRSMGSDSLLSRVIPSPHHEEKVTTAGMMEV